MKPRFVIAMLLAIVVSLFAATAYSQERAVLQKIDLPGTQYVTIMGTAELAPGAIAPLHIHPGVEVAYVLEGEGVVIKEGQPDRQVKAGDSFQTSPGVPHRVKNLSNTRTMKILTIFVVEKDKQPIIHVSK